MATLLRPKLWNVTFLKRSLCVSESGLCACLRDRGTGKEYRVEGGIPSEPSSLITLGTLRFLKDLKGKKIVSNLPCHLMFASI